MKRFYWLVLAFGTMAFASTALVGCGDTDEQASCEEDTDCAMGEVCLNGTCAETGCTTADDCSNPDHFCSGGQCPSEQEKSICFLGCKDNSECAGNDVCNLDFCGGTIKDGGDTIGRCEAPSSEGCFDNDDCEGDEVCDNDGQCVPPCTDNDDCDTGFLCNSQTGLCAEEGGACLDDTDCGDGQICGEDDLCVDGTPSCSDTAECYAQGDFYCDTDAEECVDTACGEPGNTCQRCTLGPNGGARADSAPVVYLGEQIGAGCDTESAFCSEGAPMFCEFSFFFFDPDDDFTPTNDNLFVVSGTGSTSTTFGVSETGSGIGKFGACFPDVATPGTAIFVRDDADNASNTLCVNGAR